MKLPPIEKIPEAYSVFSNDRLVKKEDCYLVKSSDNKKTYTIKNVGDIYASDDNATYWQGYPGYPVIAVLMKQGKIHFEQKLIIVFKDINWHKLNKEYNREYAKALESILENLDNKQEIYQSIQKTYQDLSNLSITLKRRL